MPYIDYLRDECKIWLMTILDKFDPSKGSKAFSYFNVVAKNWLIIKTKQRQKLNKRHVCIEDRTSLRSVDVEMIENYRAIPAQDYEMIQRENSEAIIRLLYEIKTRLSSDNELACINAIITIFESVDQLDFLNKRALFVYMRNLSSLTSLSLRHEKDKLLQPLSP